MKLLKTAVAMVALSIGTAAVATPSIERSVRVAPGGLYEIVFNPTDRDVYVAAVGPRGAQNAAVVARLDGRTLATETPISVAAAPLYGLGINTRTQVLYGTDTRNGTVTAINLRTGRVVASITHGTGAHVREVIVNEANNRAYVSVFGGGREAAGRPNQIWEIDGARNTVLRAIDVEANGLTGIALDARGNRIFGTAMSGNEVVVVDLATGRTTAHWPTASEGPTNLVYDAAGNRVFVANQRSGSLTVLNATDGSVIRQVPTGEGALGIAYNPRNQQIYVANRQAGTVTVVNAANYEVVANLQTGTLPQTIAIDPRTNAVYVTNKARGRPRGADASTPVPEDAAGDTVVIIRP